MNDIIVGTCSICGGPVVIPDIIMSTVQPTPRCRRCGATPKQDYGPIIDMEQKGRRKWI